MKKINFNPSDKENQPIDESSLANLAEQMDAQQKPKIDDLKKVEESKTEESKQSEVAKPEEIDEPLLQENPHRFVLFPIKYHEVCDAFGRV